MNVILEQNMVKPARRNAGRKSTNKYSFADMQVGMSFKWSFNTESADEREKISRRLRTAARAFSASHPEYVFETWTAFGADEQEKVENGGNGLDGLRVKRVADSKRKDRSDLSTGDGGTTGVHANGLAPGGFDEVGDGIEVSA